MKHINVSTRAYDKLSKGLRTPKEERIEENGVKSRMKLHGKYELEGRLERKRLVSLQNLIHSSIQTQVKVSGRKYTGRRSDDNSTLIRRQRR